MSAVPVSDPYGTKRAPVYSNGAGAGQYDGEPRRAHRAHHCLNFILRVLTALATAAALITMLKANQTVVVGRTTVRARWNDFGAFK